MGYANTAHWLMANFRFPMNLVLMGQLNLPDTLDNHPVQRNCNHNIFQAQEAERLLIFKHRKRKDSLYRKSSRIWISTLLTDKNWKIIQFSFTPTEIDIKCPKSQALYHTTNTGDGGILDFGPKARKIYENIQVVHVSRG